MSISYGRCTVAAVCFLLFLPVAAHEPDITILQPGGTVIVPAFPADIEVEFSVQHDEVKNLNVLDIVVNDVSFLGDAIGNPFQIPGNNNGCSAALLNSPFTACLVDGTDFAAVAFDWTVNQPGDYLLEIMVRHQGNVGSDETTIHVELVSVEYPAPPAEANAYINQEYKSSLKPRQRGCIISHIAHQHAHFEAYGPKGGPYDIGLIESDVDHYFGLCN